MRETKNAHRYPPGTRIRPPPFPSRLPRCSWILRAIELGERLIQRWVSAGVVAPNAPDPFRVGNSRHPKKAVIT